jgi:hypothetical protein
VGGWWEKDNLGTVVQIEVEIAWNTNVEFLELSLNP